MIVKKVDFGVEAREKLVSGIDIIANAVKSTLGARGQTVLIESDQHTHGLTITKDGVSVARSIILSDPTENLAVQMMREASERTATAAGDGTTTSIVLTQGLIHGSQLFLKPEDNKTKVLREVKELAGAVAQALDAMSIPVTDESLASVATISANNDPELGQIISDAYSMVGKDGVVTVENSNNATTYSEVVAGMKLDRGWTSKYFVTDQKKNEAILEDCYILVSDQEIQSLNSIEHLLAPVVQSGKSILIIAELAENALNSLNLNRLKGVIKVCAIVPPSFGANRTEIMEDIAAATGAKFISDGTGDNLYTIAFSDLGHAQKVVVSNTNTVIMTDDDVSQRVESRVEGIRAKLSDETNEYVKKHLEERLANLAGGVGVIYVGAQSDVELKEKKDRVEDAVYATKAAMEGGILPGGGIALLNIAGETCGCSTAKSILKHALQQPFNTILENGGYDVNEIKGEIALAYQGKFGYGYDVKDGKIGNMIDMGIIDPLKVTKSALENAVSVATTILSTNCIITNVRA
jgi:chaperonin GroEL